MTKKKTTAIERAVAFCGGQSSLADAIGVSPSFVNQWVSGARPVPSTRCGAIEAATGGKVPRVELRPDVFGEVAA
jgi:DNA-binding transcriptional regulator YdaS (Cro superfamily)